MICSRPFQLKHVFAMVLLVICFIPAFHSSAHAQQSLTYDHELGEIRHLLANYWIDFHVEPDAYPAWLIDGATAWDLIIAHGWPENEDVSDWLRDVLNHPDSLVILVHVDDQSHNNWIYVLEPNEIALPSSISGRGLGVDLTQSGTECVLTGGLGRDTDVERYCACLTWCEPSACGGCPSSSTNTPHLNDELTIDGFTAPVILPIWD